MLRESVFVLLSILITLVFGNDCSKPPESCPTSSPLLHIPILNIAKRFLPDEQVPSEELISSVPLISFDESYYVQMMLLERSGENKSQLGYFLVNRSNTRKIINETLVFEDVSPPCVESGHSALLGPFPKELLMGFYLVPNGWCGGTGKLYTNKAFNNNTVVSAVFFDIPSNTLVIGMEDSPDKPGDDYQDVIFQIDTAPLLLPSHLKGKVPIACDVTCTNCNYTTGTCRTRQISLALSIIMGATTTLGILLLVAIVVIVHLVRSKNLPDGWLVPSTNANRMDEDSRDVLINEEREDFDDSEVSIN